MSLDADATLADGSPMKAPRQQPSTSLPTTMATAAAARAGTSVTVAAPARIHLGFLDPSATLGRRFASLGLVIDGFDTCVEAFVPPPALGADADGSVPDVLIEASVRAQAADAEARERMRRHLATLQEATGCTAPIGLRLLAAPPAHSGFGSGTQLALACGRAFCLFHGIELPTRELATLLGRGQRSGVGLAGFDVGGLLLDGGPAVSGAPAPVLARIDFPAAWRVLLVLDPRINGLNGAAERSALEALPAFDRAHAANLCHQVLMRILPAAMESDFDQFAGGISFVQSLIGDYFAPAQGGSMYTSTAVGRVLEWIRGHCEAGIGQSSWGPTGFAVLPLADCAQALIAAARAAGVIDPALQLAVVRGRNRGADVLVRSVENSG